MVDLSECEYESEPECECEYEYEYEHEYESKIKSKHEREYKDKSGYKPEPELMCGRKAKRLHRNNTREFPPCCLDVEDTDSSSYIVKTRT